MTPFKRQRERRELRIREDQGMRERVQAQRRGGVVPVRGAQGGEEGRESGLGEEREDEAFRGEGWEGC